MDSTTKRPKRVPVPGDDRERAWAALNSARRTVERARARVDRARAIHERELERLEDTGAEALDLALKLHKASPFLAGLLAGATMCVVVLAQGSFDETERKAAVAGFRSGLKRHKRRRKRRRKLRKMRKGR